MQKKNEKGIALITLVVALLMILIISSVIIFNSTTHLKVQNLNRMYNDIRLLNNKVFLYYSKNEVLPILENAYEFGKEDEDIADILLGYNAEKFYIIDLNEIDKNLKNDLNYGKDYYNGRYTGQDIYIINKDTHQIFYVNGIQIDASIYYTIPEESIDGTNKYDLVQYKKNVANPPVIENNMTPIKITNVQNSTIETTTTYDENWYDYSYNADLSKWARVQGESDSDLYMWVPRYAYNKSTNEIVFLKGITDNPIDTSKTITDEQWIIPDAFENKEKEKQPGLWLSLGNNVLKVNSKTDAITSVYELTGKSNIGGSSNTSITLGEFSEYNPVIPVGYKTEQTEEASWRTTNGIQVDGWNDGLVIENTSGNQYVWVPKEELSSVSYQLTNVLNLESDEVVTQSILEQMLVEYGGCYIAK